MHVAFLASGIPNTETSGTALTHWTILEELTRRQHRVSALLLLQASNPHLRRERDARLQALRDTGVEVVEIPVEQHLAPPARRLVRARRLFRPVVADFYPNASLAPVISAELRSRAPDVAFVYDVSVLAALGASKSLPCLAGLVDLDHLPALYRLRYTRPVPSARYALSVFDALSEAWVRPRVMTRLLAPCDRVVNFAAHHAQWLREHGVPQCRYMPTPVADPVGERWRHRRLVSGARSRPKVLLIGHLRGTATRSGLALLADDILPRLERALGVNGFEVHIVGDFADSLPRDLRSKLDRPSVKIRGYVDDVDQEFLSADVLLVPTPIELGTRVRILVGFSYGCAVVAHSANGLGIPEMRSGYNALLASSGSKLADALLTALRDPSLRERLGRNSRMTYEQNFHPRVAAARLVEELETLAGAPGSTGQQSMSA